LFREIIQDLSAYSKKVFMPILKNVDYLYEIMLALGSSLYRVDDHSMFAVASKEFYAISASIDTRINELTENVFHKGDPVTHENILIENIPPLEEIYHSVIQVVSPEPKIFLLFIYDLYALNEAILQLFQKIDQLDEALVKHD